ncbi:MAG: LptF/LptG family permease [Candidatus Latescibacteria bacterium]|nr:LptF/LptG family permease [bacterium]MBD3424557.1 LptF/LptG family permease [Candidatus Latescibacterota bacterium]
MNMRIIDRYILRNHLKPYLFGFSIITFIFIMDFIYRYLDEFIGKGISILTVLEFFILSLGHMFALIIPMSVMPATLMAFGRMASDNEITALKASGLSLYRLIIPVLVASVLLTGGLVYFNNYILPESNHRLMALMLDIGRMKPTIQIKENIFSRSIEGYTMLIEEKDDRTGNIRGVQIFQSSEKGVPTIIVAEKGRMQYIKSKNILKFELENGEIHKMPNLDDISTYRKTLFKQYTLNIRDTGRELKRTRRDYRGDREMNISMMKARINEINRDIERRLNKMNDSAAEPVKEAFSLLFRTPVDSTVEAKAALAGSRNRMHEIRKTLHKIQNEIRVMKDKKGQISAYKVEIHKKYSIAFSCIIFVLIGSPLALLSGKRGMAVAIGFSILFFVIYYVFLIGGENLADRQYLPPWLSMWLPNIIFGVAAFILIHQTVRETRTINWDRINPVKRWRNRKKS